MKTKLFTATLALAMTSGLLTSIRADAQQVDPQTQAEIHAHLNFSLSDGGAPIQDCNLGHPGCCSTIPTFFAPRSMTGWQAVQLAKYGACDQAVALILATQCHNPGAVLLLANNRAAVCSDLAQR
jgi:hypothetical protein